MEKRGKEPPNWLGWNGPQMNRSDLRNSPNFVGSHEFQVLCFPYNVRDASIISCNATVYRPFHNSNASVVNIHTAIYKYIQQYCIYR